MIHIKVFMIVAWFSINMFSAGLFAEEISSTGCSKSDTKITGENSKYSMFADIDGLVSFNEIGCSVEWRNRELCAMEMIAFDATAVVYDFMSGEQVEMSKAFYAVTVGMVDSDKIIAFKNKSDGEKFITKRPGSKIVSYDELVDMEFSLNK